MKKLLNPADGIKDLMWSHLMTGGQKADITGLKESVYRLIQMATQKKQRTKRKQNKKYTVGNIRHGNDDDCLRSNSISFIRRA